MSGQRGQFFQGVLFHRRATAIDHPPTPTSTSLLSCAPLMLTGEEPVEPALPGLREYLAWSAHLVPAIRYVILVGYGLNSPAGETGRPRPRTVRLFGALTATEIRRHRTLKVTNDQRSVRRTDVGRAYQEGRSRSPEGSRGLSRCRVRLPNGRHIKSPGQGASRSPLWRYLGHPPGPVRTPRRGGSYNSKAAMETPRRVGPLDRL